MAVCVFLYLKSLMVPTVLYILREQTYYINLSLWQISDIYVYCTKSKFNNL